MEPQKRVAQWLRQILRLIQSGGISRRGQRQNDRIRCTVEEWGSIRESLVSVEIPAFISVNVECVIMLAPNTANGDSEMQFSFSGNNQFSLNPCGFSFNSVSNSKFLQHLQTKSAFRRYLLSETLILPRCVHTYIYPTFINEALNNPSYYKIFSVFTA